MIEAGTFSDSEYAGDSQFTCDQTDADETYIYRAAIYHSRAARRGSSPRHNHCRSRRQRDYDSDSTDDRSDSDSHSSYFSVKDCDSDDSRTYSDSTSWTNTTNDESYGGRYDSRGYDDETIYTEVKRKTRRKKRR